MSEVIKVYGYEWEILDKKYKAVGGQGILCLMKEPMKEMAFSKDKSNDYANSDIHKRLLEFTKELEKQGAEFRTAELDLTADDGTGWEHPKLLVKGAFLLTADMYRKYHRYISDKSNCWWLATAYSFSSGHSYTARFVDMDGTLGINGTFYWNHGIAPACVFSFLPQQDEKQKEIEDIKEQMRSLQERIEKLESEG